VAQAIEGGRDARGELANDHPIAIGQRRELSQAKAGDDANRAFVQANLRLVVSIAKNYRAAHAAVLDRVQNGDIAFMHAVENSTGKEASSSPPTQRGGSGRL
jgi:DNA-directed RNA polymerase sigma subunit (sigma70/sigma32)